MNPRRATRRKAGDREAADIGQRCDLTQRTLCYPASARRTRLRELGCVCGDSLESGEEEAFRGSVEAGDPPSRVERFGFVQDTDAARVEPQMRENHQGRALAERVAGWRARKPMSTAWGGMHHTRACRGAVRLRRVLGRPVAWLAVAAATRLALAFRGTLAIVRHRVDASRRRHRRGGDLSSRRQRDDQHGRQERAARLVDLGRTTLGSQLGRPSGFSEREVNLRNASKSFCEPRDWVSRYAHSSGHDSGRGRGGCIISQMGFTHPP
jgi:hypothetical protein